jgi:hypothetical protein
VKIIHAFNLKVEKLGPILRAADVSRDGLKADYLEINVASLPATAIKTFSHATHQSSWVNIKGGNTRLFCEKKC